MTNRTPRRLKGSLSDAVAEEIRVLLTRRQMTQRELADKLGMSLQALNYRLTGTQELGVNEVASIAKILGVAPTDLMPTELPADFVTEDVVAGASAA
jgi:transcriptional regulator with XRE-family HTH domain